MVSDADIVSIAKLVSVLSDVTRTLKEQMKAVQTTLAGLERNCAAIADFVGMPGE